MQALPLPLFLVLLLRRSRSPLLKQKAERLVCFVFKRDVVRDDVVVDVFDKATRAFQASVSISRRVFDSTRYAHPPECGLARSGKTRTPFHPASFAGCDWSTARVSGAPGPRPSREFAHGPKDRTECSLYLNYRMIHQILPVGALRCNCSVFGDEETKEAIVVDPGDDIEDVLGIRPEAWTCARKRS